MVRFDSAFWLYSVKRCKNLSYHTTIMFCQFHLCDLEAVLTPGQVVSYCARASLCPSLLPLLGWWFSPVLLSLTAFSFELQIYRASCTFRYWMCSVFSSSPCTSAALRSMNMSFTKYFLPKVLVCCVQLVLTSHTGLDFQHTLLLCRPDTPFVSVCAKWDSRIQVLCLGLVRDHTGWVSSLTEPSQHSNPTEPSLTETSPSQIGWVWLKWVRLNNA